MRLLAPWRTKHFGILESFRYRRPPNFSAVLISLGLSLPIHVTSTPSFGVCCITSLY